MAGTIFDQKNLSKEYVKVRWKEPYVSDALNKKMFGVFAKGIYSGFVISPGPGSRGLTVGPGSVSGGLGTGMQGGYVSGNFDETVGYSIAVQQSSNGYSKTIMIPPGPNSTMTFDATGRDGERVYIIIDAAYQIGAESTLYAALVNADYIDEDPSVIVIGHIDVPAAPFTPIDSVDIGYNDTGYPRTSPLSTPQRAGFMPVSAWEKLEYIFAWQDLCRANVSVSDYKVIEILPSQKKVNNKRVYTYIQARVASKFPRNISGQYNGGPNNDQVTNLNVVTGLIGGAHGVAGNNSFPIASVSGTPDSFQVGLVSVTQEDKIIVDYGTIYSTYADAVLPENLPIANGIRLPVCAFVASTDGSGNLKNLSPATDLLDMRPFLNVVYNGQAGGLEQDFVISSTSGQTLFDITDFDFSASNADFDITVFVNGAKQKQSISSGLDTDYRKNSATQVEFARPLNKLGTRVTVRRDVGGTITVNPGIDLNSITTNPAPDINGNRYLGTTSKGWAGLYVKDTANSTVWRIEVVNGVIQANSV
ncbi:MAG: hypothetical protein IPN68_09905 [Bacteroidetes bacterium]|nr:hypothetical protein [Bacteroidota bacterium]